MIYTIIFVLVAEICATLGQLLFKKATNELEFAHIRSFKSYRVFLKEVLQRPGIPIGLMIMTIGLLFWLMALSSSQLSIAFALGSIQYILILVASHFFLHEKIDGMRLVGTLFITIGISLVAFSA